MITAEAARARTIAAMAAARSSPRRTFSANAADAAPVPRLDRGTVEAITRAIRGGHVAPPAPSPAGTGALTLAEQIIRAGQIARGQLDPGHQPGPAQQAQQPLTAQQATQTAAAIVEVWKKLGLAADG